MEHSVPKMMTEAELREKLDELEELWKHEVDSRTGKGNPVCPADAFWYIYTRQAYLEILGEPLYKGRFRR